MADRPILFSAPMIRAILSGTKTQTRRVVKPRKDRDLGCELAPCELAGEVNGGEYRNAYCAPGDRLWVREAWQSHTGSFGESLIYAYRATDDERLGPWRPSIHMPRAASRITLGVTRVRVERLQDISEADAIAEGIERSGECNWRDYGDPHNDFTGARRSYRSLWESIHGAGAWDANPWVWVVSFRVVKP